MITLQPNFCSMLEGLVISQRCLQPCEMKISLLSFCGSTFRSPFLSLEKLLLERFKKLPEMISTVPFVSLIVIALCKIKDSGKKFDTMANVSNLAGNPMSVVTDKMLPYKCNYHNKLIHWPKPTNQNLFIFYLRSKP